jgi:hypothetical protein
MTTVLFEARVKESLDRFTAAFSEGLPEFFNEFAGDAMIITPDSKEPINGREAYRARYESALTSQKRSKTIVNRNMQITGNKAVVTQTARIAEGETTVDVLQTIVYGLTNEGVKVLHLHTAPVMPKSAKMMAPTTVRVVNEKIASMAAVTGVAQ